MAFIAADRVLETSTTTGLGPFTLLGAQPNYQSFNVGIGVGNSCYYAAIGETQYEVGIGTVGAGGTTLTRDTVLSSSNSNAPVNFAAGLKTIFNDYPGPKSVYKLPSGKLNADITAIDGTMAQYDASLTDSNFVFEAPTDGQIYGRRGSDASWQVAGGGGGTFQRKEITATAGQTAFNFDANYAVGSVSVYVNGVRQAEADFTATGGTLVTLANPVAAGDIVLLESALVAGVNFIPEAPNDGQQYARQSLGWSVVTGGGGGGLPPSTMAQFDTALTDGNFAFQAQDATLDDLTVTGAAVLDNTLTTTHTSSFGTGATASGQTKTLNIGTGGVAGSTTQINYGGAGAIGTTHAFNGTFTQAGGQFTVTTGNNPVSIGSTQSVCNFGSTQTTGAINMGGTTATGVIAIGRSTSNQTLDLGMGATLSGNTKTINIGANGVSGSTTNINYGSAVAGATTTHTFNGNIVSGGTARRFQADFSTATFSDRFLFQSSVVNGSTQLGVVPNGTGNTAGITVFNNSNPTNSVRGLFMVAGADVVIQAGQTGSGAYGPMAFYTSNLERMRVTATGYVGIGDTNPTNKLCVQSTVADNIPTVLKLHNAGSGLATDLLFGNAGHATNTVLSQRTNADFWIYQPSAAAISFVTAATERMNIAGNGNITHYASTSTYGFITERGDSGVIQQLTANDRGFRWINTSTGTSLGRYVSQGTNDGFASVSGTGFTVDPVSSCIRPEADNQLNVGHPSYRWNTVYASNGTINTSDARLKDWRGELSPAELAAAKDMAKEIGVYRWLSAIEEKGDEARLHVGVLAQTVGEIMERHGLDPHRYGFFCWDEWEAGMGFAPGAVEETPTPAGDRFGVRYDELAMFIAAAQEQRLAALEALL